MRVVLSRAALTAGWWFLAGLLSAAEPRYTLVDFGLHTQGVDLNAGGEVVYYHADTQQAFRYANGESAALPQPPEGALLPVALNDRGEVLGRVLWPKQPEAQRRAAQFFIASDDQLRELKPEGLPDGVALRQAVGIDNAGVVAALTDERPARLCFVREGRVSALFSLAATIGQHEFTVVEQTLGNAAGIVVGSVTGSHWEKKPGYTESVRDAWRGFVATERGVTDLGDFVPFAASASGRLLGRKLPPGEVLAAAGQNFRPAWRDGDVVTEFDGPAGFAERRFAAISASGLIVGEGANVTGSGFLWIAEDRHAFLFSEGVWLDLNNRVAVTEGKPLNIFSARRINDRGQILAQAMGEGGVRAVLLTPIAPAFAAAGR